jgi:CheY-like chemotaxis protein
MNDSESSDATSLAEPQRPLVLVVDDDDAIRGALCDLLEDAGFATVGARHGLEALRTLTTLPTTPTFILLDLMMPIMDGPEFRAEQIKRPEWADIPVVVVSAYGDIEARAKELDLSFVRKPLRLRPLLDVVQRYCASG